MAAGGTITTRGRPRALKGLLTSLQESGMPLEKDSEHPHVYWSVPPYWFPGGVIFDVDDWQVLVHAVLRIADNKRRAKLLERLLTGRRTVVSALRSVERLEHAVVATPLSSEEHEKVLLIEQSLIEGVPLSIRYYSMSSGRLGWRVISPQKIITEPHGRIAAFCHEHRELRWFRVDNIQCCRLEREEVRQSVPEAELQAFLDSSVDGYHDGSDQELAFHVRNPESGWVRSNLLAGMTIDREAGGDSIRIVARGAALIVARYIVGMGGAAKAESEQLKGLVRQLAKGSAEANE